MYDLYEYQSKRQRYNDLLHEAEIEKLRKVYKQKVKSSEHMKSGQNFLKNFLNLFIHRENESCSSMKHARHSIQV